MSTAQRLADALSEEADYDIHHEAKSCMRESAAELRRLDAVNAQLLEALKAIVDADFFPGAWTEHYEALAQKARAAIAATGETK